jgi:ribonucleotide monophosphatase NagD (HAD superfamily)
MGSWGNRPHGAAPLQQVLDTRTADAKQRRQGALRAAVFVIGTEEVLTKIEGVGFHSHADDGLPALNAIAHRSR